MMGTELYTSAIEEGQSGVLEYRKGVDQEVSEHEHPSVAPASFTG